MEDKLEKDSAELIDLVKYELNLILRQYKFKLCKIIYKLNKLYYIIILLNLIFILYIYKNY